MAHHIYFVYAAEFQIEKCIDDDDDVSPEHYFQFRQLTGLVLIVFMRQTMFPA
jgi:hypothetical protein